MNRFILAIAAFGMIFPVAAQAAPAMHNSAVAQPNKPVAPKTSSHKMMKSKTTAAPSHQMKKGSEKKADKHKNQRLPVKK